MCHGCHLRLGPGLALAFAGRDLQGLQGAAHLADLVWTIQVSNRLVETPFCDVQDAASE